MPLLSELLNGINRLDTNTLRTNVRYCDSEETRHKSSSNMSCSFASPLITELVPEESRHRRIRTGTESIHYSFSALQKASLMLRLNKRFETIENDRMETIVDITRDIDNRFKESNNLLQRVVQQIDSEGTVSTLLKQICDTLKASLISESPQMESLAINMGIVVDNTSNAVLEMRSLNKELDGMRDVVTLASNKTNNNLFEINDKLDQILNEMSSVKNEIQSTNGLIERLEVTSLQIKGEMSVMRTQMSEEMGLLREAITEVLPERMYQMFNTTTVEDTELNSQFDSTESEDDFNQTRDE